MTHVIVHHKNYSILRFEPETSGFVVWTSDHYTSRPSYVIHNEGLWPSSETLIGYWC
jgi:hypothetical protein